MPIKRIYIIIFTFISGVVVGGLGIFFICASTEVNLFYGSFSRIDLTAIETKLLSLELEQVDTDFGLGGSNEGSYFLHYTFKDGAIYSIQIVCPQDLDLAKKANIQHRFANKSESMDTEPFLEMSKEQVRKFVAVRLGQPDGKTVELTEAGLLAAMLVHVDGVAKIKTWGFGWGLFRSGNWHKVFLLPSKAGYPKT